MCKRVLAHAFICLCLFVFFTACSDNTDGIQDDKSEMVDTQVSEPTVTETPIDVVESPSPTLESPSQVVESPQPTVEVTESPAQITESPDVQELPDDSEVDVFIDLTDYVNGEVERINTENRLNAEGLEDNRDDQYEIAVSGKAAYYSEDNKLLYTTEVVDGGRTLVEYYSQSGFVAVRELYEEYSPAKYVKKIRILDVETGSLVVELSQSEYVDRLTDTLQSLWGVPEHSVVDDIVVVTVNDIELDTRIITVDGKYGVYKSSLVFVDGIAEVKIGLQLIKLVENDY